MEKNEFDELKEVMQTKEDVQFNKRIEKSMTKKLTRKVYKRLLLSFLTVIILIGMAHFGFKSTNYNPLKEDIDFNYLINAYLWTYHPDHNAYVSEIDEGLFGTYTLDMEIENRLKDFHTVIGDSSFVKIQKSKINYTDLRKAGLGNIILNDFEVLMRKKDKEEINHNKESNLELVEELKKLPDSSIIIASVDLNQKLSLDKIVEFMKKYPKSNFTWLAMEQFEFRQGAVTGINLTNIFGLEKLKKYPHFMDMMDSSFNKEEVTAEVLRDYFLDVLQVLLDHPKFYEMMNNNFVNRDYNFYFKEQVEFSKKTQNCIGFRVYTNRQDLIDMIESKVVSMVSVKDVRLSFYSK